MNQALDSIAQRESSLLVPTYERVPVLFERGEGVYLRDADGRRHLDFVSGIGVNALGHAHPAIVAAIHAQAQKLIHSSNLFYHEFQAPLAERLTRFSGLHRAFFCNSGTEAWEFALKIARAHGRATRAPGAKPKSRLLMMKNSFHGRTLGALATTGHAKYRAPFAPMLPGVTFVAFNDVADLESKFDATVCAIGMETIQGEGGVVPASREFLSAARRLTSGGNALLLIDEIQCGLGRTGRMFAYQHHDIEPDVVTVAKPLAAGLPLGAVLVRDHAAACIKPGMHGTTFGGGPLSCATALAFLDEISRPGFLEHVTMVGAYLKDRLRHLKTRHANVRDVRAAGLMAALELDSAQLARDAVTRMLERGIIINRTHDTVLRFLPPYIVQLEHVDSMVAALDEVLSGGATHA